MVLSSLYCCENELQSIYGEFLMHQVHSKNKTRLFKKLQIPGQGRDSEDCQSIPNSGPVTKGKVCRSASVSCRADTCYITPCKIPFPERRLLSSPYAKAGWVGPFCVGWRCSSQFRTPLVILLKFPFDFSNLLP